MKRLASSAALALLFAGCVNITNISGHASANESATKALAAEKDDCNFEKYNKYKDLNPATGGAKTGVAKNGDKHEEKANPLAKLWGKIKPAKDKKEPANEATGLAKIGDKSAGTPASKKPDTKAQMMRLLVIDDAIYNGNLLGMRAFVCGDFAKSYDFFAAAIAAQEDKTFFSKAGKQVANVLLNDSVVDYSGAYYELSAAMGYAGLNLFAQGDLQSAYGALKKANLAQKKSLNHFLDEQIKKQNEMRKNDSVQPGLMDKIYAMVIKDASAQLGVYKPEAVNFKQARMMASADFRNTYLDFLRGVFAYLNGDVQLAKSSFAQGYAVSKAKVFRAQSVIAARKKTAKSPRYVWVIYENGLGRALEPYELNLPVPSKNGFANVGMAFARLGASKPSYEKITANGKATEVIGDMDKIVEGEYKATLKTRIFSAVIKAVTDATTSGAAAKNAGGYVALGVAVFNMFKNKADVRHFVGLPSNYQAVRVPNTGHLVLAAQGEQLASQTLERNKNYLVYIKSIKPGSHVVHYFHD